MLRKFSFFVWEVFLLEVQFLCAHCNIDKEWNHIPGKQWLLLLVIYTFCAHIPGFKLCGTCINPNEGKVKACLGSEALCKWTSAVDMSEQTALLSRPLDWLLQWRKYSSHPFYHCADISGWWGSSGRDEGCFHSGAMCAVSELDTFSLQWGHGKKSVGLIPVMVPPPVCFLVFPSTCLAILFTCMSVVTSTGCVLTCQRRLADPILGAASCSLSMVDLITVCVLNNAVK